MKTTLKKLSLCDCGFPTLRTDVALNAEYEIEPSHTSTGTLICGGCERHIPVNLVMVGSSATGHAGFLPRELFDPLP